MKAPNIALGASASAASFTSPVQHTPKNDRLIQKIKHFAIKIFEGLKNLFNKFFGTRKPIIISDPRPASEPVTSNTTSNDSDEFANNSSENSRPQEPPTSAASSAASENMGTFIFHGDNSQDELSGDDNGGGSCVVHLNNNSNGEFQEKIKEKGILDTLKSFLFRPRTKQKRLPLTDKHTNGGSSVKASRDVYKKNPRSNQVGRMNPSGQCRAVDVPAGKNPDSFIQEQNRILSGSVSKPSTDNKTFLIVSSLCEQMETNHSYLETKGIYRLNASENELQKAIKLLDEETSLSEIINGNINSGDPAIFITGLMKKTLKNNPPIPHELYMEHLKSSKNPIDDIKTAFLNLPENKQKLLKRALDHFRIIAENSEKNKMNSENLARAIGISLFEQSQEPSDLLVEIPEMIQLMTSYIGKTLEEKSSDWL